jgi:oligoribonuclease
VWIDLETSGLTIDDHILEIALVITDTHLNEIEMFTTTIKQNENILNNMSDWHKRTFGKNKNDNEISLIEKCKSNEHSLALQEVEEKIVNILDKYRNNYRLPLAGSSIYMDKMFISKWMPKVNDRLHYRLLDVSSILEFTKMWIPHIKYYKPAKTSDHSALNDIRSSIRLMMFYKNVLFMQQFGMYNCYPCKIYV